MSIRPLSSRVRLKGNKLSICVVRAITGRPTEIPEDDVYICESLYDESKSLMKKLSQEGLKKFNHTSAVTDDEVYFFRRPINPAKVRMRSEH